MDSLCLKRLCVTSMSDDWLPDPPPREWVKRTGKWIDKMQRQQEKKKFTGLEDFEERRCIWLKRTGLKMTNARHTKVLSSFEKYSYPYGFDHTSVYYWPKFKTHILITEPYHEVDTAIKALNDLYEKTDIDYAHVIGRKGCGLWNPPYCIPLIVSRICLGGDCLQELADALPEVELNADVVWVMK